MIAKQKTNYDFNNIWYIEDIPLCLLCQYKPKYVQHALLAD